MPKRTSKLKNKYTIVPGETILFRGVTLYRIRALRNIPMHGVKIGDYGGYVQGYHNLSQRGSCWVGEKAKVFGGAKVMNDALVRHRAVLYQSAKACDRSKVYGDVEMYGRSCIKGSSEAYENAKIHELAHIDGDSRIHGSSTLCGNCKVTNSNIRNSTEIFADAKVIDCDISGKSTICGKSFIRGKTWVDVVYY